MLMDNVNIFLMLLGISLEELLGHVITLFKLSEKLSDCFPNMPLQHSRGSNHSTPWSTLVNNILKPVGFGGAFVYPK